jgi:hypothetical protein
VNMNYAVEGDIQAAGVISSKEDGRATFLKGDLSAMAFHEKAGLCQVGSSFFLDKVFFSRRVATVAMLPFAFSRSDSRRSVQVGRSRFSRCCHLFGAL